jgi:hypothetical protein
VVEVYRRIAPSSILCQARTPDGIRLLREKYRPGQATIVRNQDETGTLPRGQGQAVLAGGPSPFSGPGEFDFGPELDFSQLTNEFFPEDVDQILNMTLLTKWPQEEPSLEAHIDSTLERSTVNPENVSL